MYQYFLYLPTQQWVNQDLVAVLLELDETYQYSYTLSLYIKPLSPTRFELDRPITLGVWETVSLTE